MRFGVGALVLALLFGTADTASAETFSSCWVVSGVDPWSGRETHITRCRIAGGDIVDYASDDSVPGTLYPSPGTDLTGECWYLTSNRTNWVYLSLFVDGDAILGYDPTPGEPGGIILATERLPRCTSEPDTVGDPVAEVWEYVTEYIHPPPSVEISPPPGDGVTGLLTYVGVPIPAVHRARLAAGGTTLDVEIGVSGVTVDWGDGTVDTYPPSAHALSGYPDGIASHSYEVKDGYVITVSYQWRARWRTSGGAWNYLAVPDTGISVAYPVAEIVSVITG